MGQTSTQQTTNQPTPEVPTPIVVTNSGKESFIDSLSGSKTYIVALLMIIYAGSGYLLQDVSQAQAMTLILQALAIAGLRNGIQKGFDSLLEL